MTDFILLESGDRLAAEDGPGDIVLESYSTGGIPVVSCEVAFGANALDISPTFTDLSSDLDTLAVQRGRQTEDDQAQTGTATPVLMDDGRRYDPNNAAGLYYPNVQPMKPLRVRANLDGAVYPVFRGWVDIQDGWVREETGPNVATVRVPANDGFDVLNGVPVSEQLPEFAATETTGARISTIISKVFSSAWSKVIQTGATLMQPWSTGYTGPMNRANALSALRDAELTEPGFFFFGADGSAVFQDSTYRSGATSKATFCDAVNTATGRVLYESVTTRRTLVVNDAQVTRNGGTLQEAGDGPSQTKIGIRSKPYSTQHNSDADALTYAQNVVAAKKDSRETLESLTLQPGTDPATWAQVLGRELGDRITVIRTPQNTGSPVTADYFIEAINLAYGPGFSASCVWRLSPAT